MLTDLEVLETDARDTPLLDVGLGILLKDETRNQAGSFKLRGVAAMARLSPKAFRRGSVTVSTGNTGIAAAIVANALGAPCEVWIPGGTSAGKVRRISGLGATVVVRDQAFSEVSKGAAASAHARGLVFISPGSSQPYVNGLLSLFVEVLQAAPHVRSIVVPTGGGGLLAAGVLALKGAVSKPAMIGAQAWSARPVYDLCRHQGSRASRSVHAAYAECISGDVEEDALIRGLLDGVTDLVLVTRSDLRTAAEVSREWLPLAPELGALAGLAAALKYKTIERPVAVVVTGRAT